MSRDRIEHAPHTAATPVRPLRMLFTSAGGSGHSDPLLPLAFAAQARGHAVAFATRPWMVSSLEALGLPVFAAGSDLGLAPVRRPLRVRDAESEMRAAAAGFGQRIARERARDLLGVLASWQPDLVVCEELDFGAMVAAERSARPHATVLVCAAGFVRPSLFAPAVDAVRAEHGLPADPALAALARHLVLSPLPPSLCDPASATPATLRSFRAASRPAPPDEALGAWLARRSGRPLVYATLGTVFALESGDLFARIVSALRDLEVDAVVSVGPDLDPAELGPQPAHVRVTSWVSHAQLLPHCDAVISHGGSGTVLAALAHGVPLILLPMGADQPRNAARCAALGVARVLDAQRATPGALRDAVAAVLRDAAMREAARRLRDEIAALPEPAHAVALLEALAHRGVAA